MDFPKDKQSFVSNEYIQLQHDNIMSEDFKIPENVCASTDSDPVFVQVSRAHQNDQKVPKSNYLKQISKDILAILDYSKPISLKMLAEQIIKRNSTKILRTKKKQTTVYGRCSDALRVLVVMGKVIKILKKNRQLDLYCKAVSVQDLPKQQIEKERSLAHKKQIYLKTQQQLQLLAELTRVNKYRPNVSLEQRIEYPFYIYMASNESIVELNSDRNTLKIQNCLRPLTLDEKMVYFDDLEAGFIAKYQLASNQDSN